MVGRDMPTCILLLRKENKRKYIVSISVGVCNMFFKLLLVYSTHYAIYANTELRK